MHRLALIVALLTVACGQDKPSTAADTGAAATTPPAPTAAAGTFDNCTATNATASNAVALTNYKFSPSCIKIAAGSSVTFTDDDAAAHTVTADDGSFDKTPFAAKATFSQPFAAAGTVKVHCTYHDSMLLTVLVQ